MTGERARESPSSSDRVEASELLGRYGRLIDLRNWPALADVFTPTATFDLSPISGPLLEGLPAIQEYMANRARHPVAHHITNAHIERLEHGTLHCSCMLVAVQLDGSVASGHYADELVRVPAGLRIRQRRFCWLLAPRPDMTARRGRAADEHGSSE
jgi:hypothetical protein